MDLFDVLILLAVVGYAIGGYRSGAVIGLLSMIGFFGGAVLGAQVAEPIGSHIADGRAQVPVAILCVLLLAVLGQLLGVFVAGLIRQRLVTPKGRPWDSGIGAIIGVVSVLLVAWMIAVPLASSPYPSLAKQASHSTIVRQVDGAMPGGARHLYSSMRQFFDRSGFPPVFGDLPSTSVVAVSPPPKTLTPGLRTKIVADRSSILKVLSQAPQCDRGIEGSGFVYARDRILTNAHVVAGASSVAVQLSSGRQAQATVVVYDPDRDVAVLSVPGLDATPLTIATHDAARGDPAAVVGYPQNGPYTVVTARVRGKSTVDGTNIYGHGDVTRSIYSIRAVVREGNSGGPLLAANGTVLGVVFATARDSGDTGFVLSQDEIAPDAAAGRSRTRAVSTGGCTPD